MTTDFRDAVFLSVREIMKDDLRSVVMYNDMGAAELDRLRKDYPARVLNVGICEQNMASLASGLALSARRVFIYGIIAHVFARSYEQIRNDICCPALPVTILGIGSGLSYGADGPTHHGVQDIAVMRTLPNMTIYNPADCVAAGAFVRMAAEAKKPAYIRMDKEVVSDLYAADADFSLGFQVLREGEDIALVATGVLVHRALQTAEELSREGIDARVVDVFRLKPVDSILLQEALAGVPAVVTLEENSPIGGLGSIVADLLARGQRHPMLDSVCLGDEPLMGSSSRLWADARFGFSAKALCGRIRSLRLESGRR